MIRYRSPTTTIQQKARLLPVFIMAIMNSIQSLYLLSAAICAYIIYHAVYLYFISPLCKIPGPWYASLTKWWMVYKTMKGIRAKTIHDLHERYGPWVRISPNEVSTCDSEAIVPIYGVNSDFIKTEFYTYQLRGIPELFTMASRKQHAMRRRQLSHLFSMSTIIEYEPIIGKHVQICMDLISEQGKAGKPSNLYDWWHFLSMDITCELSFGLTFNMLYEGTKNHYVKDLYGSLTIEPIRWHFGWLNRFAAWAPVKFIRDAESCSIRAMNRGVKIVQQYKANPEKKRNKDLLQKLLNAYDENGQPLTDEDLNCEATGFILAGSHTTSSSLAWIVWRLLKEPDILTAMVKELDEALSGLPRTALPTHKQLEKLPWLNCIIKEGLRIDTAVPGSTPRYVPTKGAHINGRYLPGGTIVSAQAYSCHRDPVVFPDPDRFIPSRWLNTTPQMNRMYIPFGADGPRKCIGMHLAYMELRVILASLFYRFDLSMADDVTDESMDLVEFWLANPKAQRLNVIAKERA